MLTKLAFYEQQRFAEEKRLYSSFVTRDFKKRQNGNETSLRNGTKFASLVIKL